MKNEQDMHIYAQTLCARTKAYNIHARTGICEIFAKNTKLTRFRSDDQRPVVNDDEYISGVQGGPFFVVLGAVILDLV